jgi:hypothetical protein
MANSRGGPARGRPATKRNRRPESKGPPSLFEGDFDNGLRELERPASKPLEVRALPARDHVFPCDCEGRLPGPLCKSLIDPFDYAAGLATGEVVRFTSATLDDTPGWVTLRGLTDDAPVEGLAHPCPRGVSVRVDAIVWCADAPDGS